MLFSGALRETGLPYLQGAVAMTMNPRAWVRGTRKLAVVDCGSGYSRVERYSAHKPGGGTAGLVHLDSTKRLPAIHPVIAAGRAAQGEWIELLRAELGISNQGDGERIAIGCTAGVRDAMQSGEISDDQWDEFRALVASSQLGGSRHTTVEVKVPL